MDLNDFNCSYLNKLLENISKEQKSVFFHGDFNVNLLNYNEHNQTNEFLDSLASNSYIALILQPTRITSHSNTLIDNIFSNYVIDSDIISGNLTATISDHLPQFSLITNMFGNIPSNKSNIYERDWPKFDRENFILDYFSVNWEDLLKIDELNADNSTKIFLDKINMLLYIYAPLKRVKNKLKFKSKPWITLGLQKSISLTNKLLTNFINKKDPILKEECHTNYKKYRNLVSTLMKKSKQAFHNRYFERNWNNIKNTWKGIKSLISLKTVAFSIPTVPGPFLENNLGGGIMLFRCLILGFASLSVYKAKTV